MAFYCMMPDTEPRWKFFTACPPDVHSKQQTKTSMQGHFAARSGRCCPTIFSEIRAPAALREWKLPECQKPEVRVRLSVRPSVGAPLSKNKLSLSLRWRQDVQEQGLTTLSIYFSPSVSSLHQISAWYVAFPNLVAHNLASIVIARSQPSHSTIPSSLLLLCGSSESRLSLCRSSWCICDSKARFFPACHLA